MRYLILLITFMSTLVTNAQDVIKLPDPFVGSSKYDLSLMGALSSRSSNREFGDEEINNQDLSTLLWCATGVNREDVNKLTAPSAINAQDIMVYVCSVKGAYLYDPFKNELKKVTDGDLRVSIAGRQKGMEKAPISLVLVSNQAKFGGESTNGAMISGAMDAGYVSQNIYLACAAMGLNTVARATMDKEALQKSLKLTEQQVLFLNHPIGHKPFKLQQADGNVAK